MEFVLLPRFSQMLRLKAETIKYNYVLCAFSLLKPLLLGKALFKAILLPCVYFAFSAIMGLFKRNNDDDGYK